MGTIKSVDGSDAVPTGDDGMSSDNNDSHTSPLTPLHYGEGNNVAIDAILDDLYRSALVIELHASDGVISAHVHQILESVECRVIAPYSCHEEFIGVMDAIKRWKEASYNPMKNPFFFYRDSRSVLVCGVPIICDDGGTRR